MDKQHLLFVDDEPMVLRGLQRSLRKMRHEWEVLYAEDGEAALALLASRPVDVVVTDMRMPGMDGAQLLAIVKERFPQVVRIILSGQLDRDMTLQSVRVAHQLLAKPCDIDVLQSALQKTFALNRILTDEAMRKVVARIDALPSMPASCAEIMTELQSEDASIQRVAELIARDLGMTAKILQMVNSAFFGLYRRVNDAQGAVMYLGLDAIKALVLSINVFSAFNRRKIPFFDVEDLWRHSLAVGGYARQIMARTGVARDQTSMAFLAGMLHDIGKLILAVNFREQYRELLHGMPSTTGERLQQEMAVFGTTHAEVGAYLMGLWGLEPQILAAIAFHHRPLESGTAMMEALTAVHVANGFDHGQADPHENDEAFPGGIDAAYIEKLGIAGKIVPWRQACTALKEDAS
jgi:HD-like signal output (HDOD) protein